MTTIDLVPALDTQSPVPLYHQIVEHFQALIDGGVLVPGDQMPSERAIAEDAGVSRMTVRQAMRTLVAQSYCERLRGRGIFVRSRPIVVDSAHFEGFTDNMERQGLPASTKGVSAQVTAAPEDVLQRLELDEGSRCIELTRLRLVSDRPAVLETEWFSAIRFPGLETMDLSASLYRTLIDTYGVRIADTLDTLEAHIPTATERELLGLEKGIPVIVRNRVGRDQDGIPTEIVRSLYHPEMYQFRMALLPVTR